MLVDRFIVLEQIFQRSRFHDDEHLLEFVEEIHGHRDIKHEKRDNNDP